MPTEVQRCSDNVIFKHAVPAAVAAAASWTSHSIPSTFWSLPDRRLHFPGSTTRRECESAFHTWESRARGWGRGKASQPDLAFPSTAWGSVTWKAQQALVAPVCCVDLSSGQTHPGFRKKHLDFSTVETPFPFLSPPGFWG